MRVNINTTVSTRVDSLVMALCSYESICNDRDRNKIKWMQGNIFFANKIAQRREYGDRKAFSRDRVLQPYHVTSLMENQVDRIKAELSTCYASASVKERKFAHYFYKLSVMEGAPKN